MKSAFDYTHTYKCHQCGRYYFTNETEDKCIKYCSPLCFVKAEPFADVRRKTPRNKDGEYDKVCKYCKEKFTSKSIVSLYCSDICRRSNLQKKNKKRREKSKALKAPPGEAFEMYPDADRSERISRGKEEQRKILSCSVECLLDELGDLE